MKNNNWLLSLNYINCYFLFRYLHDSTLYINHTALMLDQIIGKKLLTRINYLFG